MRSAGLDVHDSTPLGRLLVLQPSHEAGICGRVLHVKRETLYACCEMLSLACHDADCAHDSHDDCFAREWRC